VPFLHALKAFVEHPTTMLVVALILIVSGFIEAYDTFAEDVSHLRVRIGHGIILLGFINAFSSLPAVVDGIERWFRLEEAKAEARRAAVSRAGEQKTYPHSLIPVQPSNCRSHSGPGPPVAGRVSRLFVRRTLAGWASSSRWRTTRRTSSSPRGE
jgi:hypothetical protein